jgi:hypothetical protein
MMNTNSISTLNPTMLEGLLRAGGYGHNEGIKDVIYRQVILDILSDGKKMRCTELSIEIEKRLGLEENYISYQKISAILRKLRNYVVLVKREDFKTGEVILVGTRPDGSLIEVEEMITLFSLA